MKHVELIALIAFILGVGLGYVITDDQRIERESGVQVVSK